MARPLRIEFPGAIYHVTSRGDRREPIFLGNGDRVAFLAVLAQSTQRFDAQVLTYCLMDNHYHLVLHTRQANLSQLMRHLNGVYTQTYNRCHGKVGHVFQGRFKAILVDRDNYLLELCRYVELNPVRASMVPTAADWPWSSYLAHTGIVEVPEWLDTAGLHGYLLGRPVLNAADQQRAATRYAALVASAPDLQIWPQGLRQQIYLGDEQFVERMQELMAASRTDDREIPKLQRITQIPLSTWLEQATSREEGLYLAHTQGGMSMTSMAQTLGLSVSRISRLIANYEKMA